MKELRALIEQAGMTHHDCVEKNDLRARARDALVKLDGAAGGATGDRAAQQHTRAAVMVRE